MDRKKVNADALDTEAIRPLDPDYADTYNNRGNAYADKGELDKAVADYTEAIWFDPNYVLAYVNRGFFYANKEEYARARAN
jgi:tetratricopeptide (TPR) repeat protein